MSALSEAQVKQFHDEGYLAVEGALDIEQDIEPVISEYTTLLGELCEQLHLDGKLGSTYRDLPLGERLCRVLSEAGQAYYRHFDISLPQAVVDENEPIHLGPAVFNLLTSSRLLDAVESLIGPEIYSNPIQHVRIKPPERFVPEEHRNSLTAVTDWHQDQGVALPEADESMILTVWLPITDATEENGCLKVIPRSHREDLAPHCLVYQDKKGLMIPEKYMRIEDTTPVPIKQGGILFMHRRTMHASLTNHSDDIRWSFDLRYNPIGHNTGRPAFPGFVARSRANSASALTDWREWANLWYEARARLSGAEKPTFNRWVVGAPACA